MFDKELFAKFITAVELVAPQGRVAIGLVVNKSGVAVDWGDFIPRAEIIEVDALSDSAGELIKKLSRAVEDGKWIILEIKDGLPSELFAGLRTLATSNRIQKVGADGIGDVKLSKARIIVIGLPEVLDRIKKTYSDFIGLFGPVVEL